MVVKILVKSYTFVKTLNNPILFSTKHQSHIPASMRSLYACIWAQTLPNLKVKIFQLTSNSVTSIVLVPSASGEPVIFSNTFSAHHTPFGFTPNSHNGTIQALVSWPCISFTGRSYSFQIFSLRLVLSCWRSGLPWIYVSSDYFLGMINFRSHCHGKILLVSIRF